MSEATRRPPAANATETTSAETAQADFDGDDRQLAELLDRLRAMGERITVARRAVLETLLAEPDLHLSADELAQRIHRDHPSIHLSTVYRTVEFLTDTGLLTEVRVGHGPSSYHFATDSHHHAVCDVCGTEVALPADLFDAVTTRLLREHGFASDPHHLTIAGVCAGCQAAGRSASGPGGSHLH